KTSKTPPPAFPPTTRSLSPPNAQTRRSLLSTLLSTLPSRASMRTPAKDSMGRTRPPSSPPIWKQRTLQPVRNLPPWRILQTQRSCPPSVFRSRFLSPTTTRCSAPSGGRTTKHPASRSEEHTSELQSRENLVC